MLEEIIADEIDMTSTKPARRYIASAQPTSRGTFYAVWAAPGLIPNYVYSDLDRTKRYEYQTVEEAEASARRTLFAALNQRAELKFGAPERQLSIRMTSEEFAAEMAEADVSPTEFAQLWGTSIERVVEWLDGEKDIPFPVRTFLRGLRRPDVLKEAIDLTNKYTNYKPSWFEHQARRARYDQLAALVKRELPKGADATTLKYEHAVNSREPTLRERIRMLEEICLELGLSAPPAPADSKAPARG